MMVEYFCDSGSTDKLFCRCFLLLQEATKTLLSAFVLPKLDYCNYLFDGSCICSSVYAGKTSECSKLSNKIYFSMSQTKSQYCCGSLVKISPNMGPLNFPRYSSCSFFTFPTLLSHLFCSHLLYSMSPRLPHVVLTMTR